jgi:hypothetical protein
MPAARCRGQHWRCCLHYSGVFVCLFFTDSFIYLPVFIYHTFDSEPEHAQPGRPDVHYIVIGAYEGPGNKSAGYKYARGNYPQTVISEAQRAWLQRDLAAVNRSVTPWVIGNMHPPCEPPAPLLPHTSRACHTVAVHDPCTARLGTRLHAARGRCQHEFFAHWGTNDPIATCMLSPCSRSIYC